MEYRLAYIAVLTAQMEEHMRQAWILCQLLQQELGPQAARPAAEEEMELPPIDLSFLD
uniref:Uncharacterized protein n=1 Tax=viral metagenome TaxID=1070528 RepID=A0A6C0JJ99_9ZZZZ